MPAALLAVVVVLAPAASFRVGHSIGTGLAGPGFTGTVARGLVLGPMLAGAVAGTALAASLPGRSAFGEQVAAAPIGRAAPVAATVLVPALAGALVVLPSLLAACAALADELPGGPVAGLALAVGTLAALPAGAIVAEGAIATARSRYRRSLAILACVPAWGAVGFPLGAPGLGPLAPIAGALRGSRSAWAALAVASLALIALTSSWVAVAGGRPVRHGVRRVREPRLAHTGRLVLPASVTALVARRSDVRFAAAGAVAFGLGGVAFAAVTDAVAPASFLLGTTTALLGSVFCPLVVCGALRDGRWLWSSAPLGLCGVVRYAALVGVAAAALPVVIVGAAAALASGAPLRSLGAVSAYVVLGSAAALVAGAVIPWSGAGASDQFSSFAALAGVAIGLSLVVGLAAPRLVALGLPDTVVALLACATSLGVALAALGRRLGAGSR